MNAKSKQQDTGVVTGAKSKGSRLAVLDDLTKMEMNNVELNEAKNSVAMPEVDDLRARVTDQTKEKNSKASPAIKLEAQNASHLNISHDNLMAKLRSLSKNGPGELKITVSPIVVRPKRAKDKVLNDVTNNLDVQPINLNQMKAGSNQPKGIKRINQVWVNEDIIELVLPHAQTIHSNRPMDN